MPETATDTKPDSISPIQTLSEKVGHARTQLLHTFQTQLDSVLANKLILPEKGLPFVAVEDDAPQVAAIKKVINCLHHAEKGLGIWEQKETLGTWRKFKARFHALYQVYKSVAFLYDATPEIQGLIAENYGILKPVFSGLHETIKASGWSAQFLSLDGTEKASTVISQGIALLGPHPEQWNGTNPVVGTFAKLSALITKVTEIKDISSPAQQSLVVAEVRELLSELAKNEFINQFSIDDIEHSKIIQDLFSWFKEIEADGFQFTEKSIQRYLDWTNYNLPLLITAVDQLERKNYLKTGTLADGLCGAIDTLSRQANQLLEESEYGLIGRVVTSDQLTEVRAAEVETSQRALVQRIHQIEAEWQSSITFFDILNKYRGQPLAAIAEPDRHQLRQHYPNLQRMLAHADSGLERQFTSMLNDIGPEPNNSWWQRHVTGTMEYVSGYVRRSEIDKVLTTQEYIGGEFKKQINGERLKFSVAEHARLRLDPDKSKSLEDRVSLRMYHMGQSLPEPPVKPVLHAGEFVPVKVATLNTLRGHIAYLQELKMGEKIHSMQIEMDVLLKRHLSPEDQIYFPEPPYNTELSAPDEPELITQFKEVQNSLFHLAKSLRIFERIGADQGIVGQAKSLYVIASEGLKLKRSIMELSPTAQEVIAPLIVDMMGYGTNLSQIDKRENNESLAKLKAERAATSESVEHIPVQTENPYISQIRKARDDLLSRLKGNLSPVVAEQLTHQKQGVPFQLDKNDSPKVAAIKKIINSMYYAETALMMSQDLDTQSVMGKFTAVHKGMAALSHLYKGLSLFAQTTPEAQHLIRENRDMLQPMIDGAQDLITNALASTPLSSTELTKNAGSILGRGIHMLQPDPEHYQQLSLIQLVSELPKIMNGLAISFDKDRKVSRKLLITPQGQIKSIDAVAEMMVQDTITLSGISKIPNAIIGLIDLNTKLKREADRLQETTVIAYQKWVEKEYPQLITFLDELEIRNYLKPGSLSGPIVDEIDKINNKLNEYIESRPQSHMKLIDLIIDLAPIRKSHLKEIAGNESEDIFKISEKVEEAKEFFEILKQYSDKSISEIPAGDRELLRDAFAQIQHDMAVVDLDSANRFVTIVKALEHSEQSPELDLQVSRLLQMEQSVFDNLNTQHQGCLLKIKVIEHAINQMPSLSKSKDEMEIGAQVDNETQHARRRSSRRSPDDLKTLDAAEVDSIRGTLSSLQQLELSSVIASFRGQFSLATQNALSPHANSYLIKSEGEELYQIKESDPLIPRQIKELENAFYHLESALKQFEQIRKNDSLIVQTMALVELGHHTTQLMHAFNHISPELKNHYGPLFEKAMKITNALHGVSYNHEDKEELQSVLNDAHEEILKRSDLATKAATPSPAAEVGSRGAKLVIKYAHVISPQLEEVRLYLESHYNGVFPEATAVIKALPRGKLGSDEYMVSEVKRLSAEVDHVGGLNLKTAQFVVDVSRQFERVAGQVVELADMVNQLVKKDYAQLKSQAYRELIVKLSQEEDHLCLNPGTLITPAMANLNQLFISAALELDMTFSKKLALMDEAAFVSIVLEQTRDDLKELSTLEDSPQNSLAIQVKKDKIGFLEAHLKAVEIKNMAEIKKLLLDDQFEVNLRKKQEVSTLEPMMARQYERMMRLQYDQGKKTLLNKETSGEDLASLMQILERKNLGHYVMVDKACKKLDKFASKLPDTEPVKDYIKSLIKELNDETLSIHSRSNRVKGLPRDSDFCARISSVDSGKSFLAKFRDFIEVLTSSIAEWISKGVSLIDTYRRKKMERALSHIERTTQIKDGLEDIIKEAPSAGPEQSNEHELEQENEFESDSEKEQDSISQPRM